MCGRFTLYADFNKILERFDIAAATVSCEQYQPNYNIAPSNLILAVVSDGRQNRLGHLKWGLIPSWSKDANIGYKMINARAETLFERKSFQNAFQKRRCLIIADSFYEWKRQDKKTKTPMCIKLKKEELFAMAGLWERWRSPDGASVYSCTIITTTANPLMKEIHHRMPVILKQEDEKIWLDPAVSDPSKLQDLLKPFPSDLMEAYEVSNLVNSPKNNSPDLIQSIR